MSKTATLVIIAILAILGIFSMRFTPNAMNTHSMVAGSSPHPEQFKQWREFSPPDNEFTVLLPSLPQHANDHVEDVKTKEPREYHMYVAEQPNGTLFMISIIQLKDDTQAKMDDTLLKNVMNDTLAATPKGILKTMKMGSFDGHSAIDFQIENDEVTLDGKVFFNDHKIYALSSVAKKDFHNQQEFDYFIKSFKLKTLQPK